MGRRLIIGLDPGTTAAYAILGISGEVIAVKSSRQLNLDRVIRETTAKGRPLIVGTDRRKVPGMVSRYAAKTGALKVTPGCDVSESEKSALVRDFKAENEHQKDALAAAMIAYKQYEPLIGRVRRHLAKKRKAGMDEEVLQIVLRERISIDKALMKAELPSVGSR